MRPPRQALETGEIVGKVDGSRRPKSGAFHVQHEFETWTLAQFMAASLEERRAFMRELLAEWEMNRARELAEDEAGDGLRGHWGD